MKESNVAWHRIVNLILPFPAGEVRSKQILQSRLAPNIVEGITVGISQDAVRRDALLRFGSPAAVKERVGMADMGLFLENIASDIPQAVRQLCKSPGLAATSQSKLTGKLQNWLDEQLIFDRQRGSKISCSGWK